VKSDIKILHVDDDLERSGFRALIGDVLVRREIAKFKKIRYHTHENIGYGEISLPEEEMHTRSVVLLFGAGSASGRAFDSLPLEIREEVISRIGTLIKNVAPVFLLCEASDLGVAERLRDAYTDTPALYVYDMYPGGTGLSEGLLERADEVMRAARERLSDCPCDAGCPSCIGPTDQRSNMTINRKSAVSEFLAFLSDA